MISQLLYLHHSQILLQKIIAKRHYCICKKIVLYLLEASIVFAKKVLYSQRRYYIYKDSIIFATHERTAPQGNISEIFFRYFKTGT